MPNDKGPNRDLAKRIILEIVSQAGEGIGRTKLFKAFWLAHLYYANKENGYLSDWPVIRMPNGPGIDEGHTLLRELVAAGLLRCPSRPEGPFQEITCILTETELPKDLSEAAIQAVQDAVAYVVPLSATRLTELSHEMSRSWQETENGRELNIYSDLVPDELFIEQREVAEKLDQAYDEMFK